MTYAEFAELVRTMRRDQEDRERHRTHAAAMKAAWSEKQVDDALAMIPHEAEPDPDTIIEGNP